MNTEELINEQTAAEALAVAVRTLQWWRIRGGGPKFVKLGRAVRYRRADLMDWIDENTRRSTSATAPEVRT